MFQLYNALNYLFQLREEMFTENLKFKKMKWWCSQYFFWIRHVSTRYSVCTSSFRKGFFPPANKVAGRYCFHRCLSLHREEGGVGTLHASRDRSHGRVSPSPHIRPEYLTPPPQHQTWGPASLRHQTWGPALLLTSGGDHWRPVQTCSFEDLPPLVLTSSGSHRSRWYAPYWNAVLSVNMNTLVNFRTTDCKSSKVKCQCTWLRSLTWKSERIEYFPDENPKPFATTQRYMWTANLFTTVISRSFPNKTLWEQK